VPLPQIRLDLNFSLYDSDGWLGDRTLDELDGGQRIVGLVFKQPRLALSPSP